MCGPMRAARCLGRRPPSRSPLPWPCTARHYGHALPRHHGHAPPPSPRPCATPVALAYHQPRPPGQRANRPACRPRLRVSAGASRPPCPAWYRGCACQGSHVLRPHVRGLATTIFFIKFITKLSVNIYVSKLIFTEETPNYVTNFSYFLSLFCQGNSMKVWRQFIIEFYHKKYLVTVCCCFVIELIS